MKIQGTMYLPRLDALAAAWIELTTRKFAALTGSGYIDGQKVLLVKPQTYMNLSGGEPAGGL